MNIRINYSSIHKPCSKCPYKLGIIETLVNPCPNCKLNNYSTYKVFIKQLNKEAKTDISDDNREE